MFSFLFMVNHNRSLSYFLVRFEMFIAIINHSLFDLNLNLMYFQTYSLQIKRPILKRLQADVNKNTKDFLVRGNIGNNDSKKDNYVHFCFGGRN